MHPSCIKSTDNYAEAEYISGELTRNGFVCNCLPIDITTVVYKGVKLRLNRIVAAKDELET